MSEKFESWKKKRELAERMFQSTLDCCTSVMKACTAFSATQTEFFELGHFLSLGRCGRNYSRFALRMHVEVDNEVCGGIKVCHGNVLEYAQQA